MDKKPTLKWIPFAFFCALLLMTLGCDLDVNDPFDIVKEYDPFAKKAETPDNSVYLGQFDLIYTVGDCAPQTVTFVIHAFHPDREKDHHLYIHVKNNKAEFEGVNSDLNEFFTQVEIVDNTIIVNETISYDPETGEIGKNVRYLDFAEDYNSFFLTGETINPLPGDCGGILEGVGKRVVSEPEDNGNASFGTGYTDSQTSTTDSDTEPVIRPTQSR